MELQNELAEIRRSEHELEVRYKRLQNQSDLTTREKQQLSDAVNTETQVVQQCWKRETLRQTIWAP